jgi:hypothetical protein
MSEIKLVMRNRTNLDLIFTYKSTQYDVSAGMSKTVPVELGHLVSVHAPKGTKVKKREVEPDFYIYALQDNIAIDCRLVSWQLQLSIGTEIY